MDGMADVAELLKKQADAAGLATRMAEEKDPQRRNELSEQLQASCAELGQLARALEARFAPAATGTETRVALTPEQRARIAGQTGVGIEVVTLRDTADRAWSRQIPRLEPREVEAIAAEQAAQSRLKAETRRQVEQIVGELEKLGVPELAETIAALRRDVVE